MKKKVISFVFTLTIFIKVYSQTNGLSLNYYNQHVGLGGSVLYQKDLGKGHILGIGLKYHDNYNWLSSEFVDFHKTAYAQKFIEHIGFIIDYSYSIKPKNWLINPCIFYNAQYLKAGLREQDWIPNPIDTRYWKPQYDENAPLSILEHYIGLRIEMQIVKNTYINFSFSGGFIHYWNFSEKLKAEQKANSKTVFGKQWIFGITQKF